MYDVRLCVGSNYENRGVSDVDYPCSVLCSGQWRLDVD